MDNFALLWPQDPTLIWVLLGILSLAIVLMIRAGWYFPKTALQQMKAKLRAGSLIKTSWQVTKVERRHKIVVTISSIKTFETTTVEFNYQRPDVGDIQNLEINSRIEFVYCPKGVLGESPYEPGCYLRILIKQPRALKTG